MELGNDGGVHKLQINARGVWQGTLTVRTYVTAISIGKKFSEFVAEIVLCSCVFFKGADED
jgi:hypothetical protein